jgi:hypothetical protein
LKSTLKDQSWEHGKSNQKEIKIMMAKARISGMGLFEGKVIKNRIYMKDYLWKGIESLGKRVLKLIYQVWIYRIIRTDKLQKYISVDVHYTKTVVTVLAMWGGCPVERR